MYNVHARKEKEWNSLHALLQSPIIRTAAEYLVNFKNQPVARSNFKEPHHLFFVLPDDKIDTEKTQVPVVA